MTPDERAALASIGEQIVALAAADEPAIDADDVVEVAAEVAAEVVAEIVAEPAHTPIGEIIEDETAAQVAVIEAEAAAEVAVIEAQAEAAQDVIATEAAAEVAVLEAIAEVTEDAAPSGGAAGDELQGDGLVVAPVVLDSGDGDASASEHVADSSPSPTHPWFKKWSR